MSQNVHLLSSKDQTLLRRGNTILLLYSLFDTSDLLDMMRYGEHQQTMARDAEQLKRSGAPSSLAQCLAQSVERNETRTLQSDSSSERKQVHN